MHSKYTNSKSGLIDNVISRYAFAMPAILLASQLFFLQACSTPKIVDIRYTGKASLYPAVAYVMELSSTRLVKADIINNEYITSYIIYIKYGRINRFRLYMSLRDQVFVTEVGDVQIQISRGGFVSWENVDAQSLADMDVYTRNIGKEIIRAASNSQFANFKLRLQNDLEFNKIVLKDLPENRRAQWIADNMIGHVHRFNSKIERILHADENKRYGKYLLKMSRKDEDLKSDIKVELYSDNAAYTRNRIGDGIYVSGSIVDAIYSDTDNVLTLLLKESK